jgi:Tfp pilus assembly protein PilO
MKVSLSSDSWISAVLVVAAAIACAALFLVPGHRQLTQMREELDMKRTFAAQAGTLGTALASTGDELQRTLQYNQAWTKAGPGRLNLSVLYGQISTMGKQAGISTTRFDPDPAQNLSRLCRIPLVIGCTGSFRQTCQFLQGIESLPATLWINKLHMGVDMKNGKVVQTDIDLEIFADNPDISGQVNYSEQPIREETGRSGTLSSRGTVERP